MPDANACLVLRRYAVTNGGWTPIVAPIQCNTFWLREASGKAFNVASDPASDYAWDAVGAGDTFGFQNVAPSFPQAIVPTGIRFDAGMVLLYVQAVDGSGATVICYYGL
jgi:hypothetical protein